MVEPTESYGMPWFKRGQRVIVVKNIFRNHARIDHLLGQKVIITGRSWERGAYWYTIRTATGEKIRALRMGDFKPLEHKQRHYRSGGLIKNGPK